jgi:hypothetical protein
MASAKAYEASCEAIKDIERDKRRKGKAEKSDDDDQPDESEPLKTHKIRVYPTPDQAKVLRRFCGAHRWTYNQCVQAQKKGERLSLKSPSVRYPRGRHARLQEGLEEGIAESESVDIQVPLAQAQCDGHVRRAPQTYERRG